jgi:predicted CoA-binding protein
MPDLKHDDQALRDVLTQAKTIAVVGHSDRPHRTSYQIAQFLRRAGYTVYPVNPTVSEIEGQLCYPTLEAVPEAIDIVNVFRQPQHLPEVTEAAIAIGAKTLWAQLGIHHPQAAQQALEAGLNVVMDSCIKIEYLRLGIQH